MPDSSSSSPHLSDSQVSQKVATLVIGASPQPWRYAFQAIVRLQSHDHPVYAYGKRTGEINGVPIELDRAAIPAEEIDTVTLYVGPARQADLYDWLVELAPRRVIFNPGTENPELMHHLASHQIESVVACTLVMLGTGQY